MGGTCFRGTTPESICETYVEEVCATCPLTNCKTCGHDVSCHEMRRCRMSRCAEPYVKGSGDEGIPDGAACRRFFDPKHHGEFHDWWPDGVMHTVALDLGTARRWPAKTGG